MFLGRTAIPQTPFDVLIVVAVTVADLESISGVHVFRTGFAEALRPRGRVQEVIAQVFGR